MNQLINVITSYLWISLSLFCLWVAWRVSWYLLVQTARRFVRMERTLTEFDPEGGTGSREYVGEKTFLHFLCGNANYARIAPYAAAAEKSQAGSIGVALLVSSPIAMYLFWLAYKAANSIYRMLMT